MTTPLLTPRSISRGQRSEDQWYLQAADIPEVLLEEGTVASCPDWEVAESTADSEVSAKWSG